MAEREMMQVKVYVGGSSMICLSQQNFGEDDTVVILHPSQIDVVIEWLKEAKQEAGGQK